MRSYVSPFPRATTLLILLLFTVIVLSMSSVSQGRIGKLKAKVDIGRGDGGASERVTFDLFRVQSRSCCDACKVEPKRPCRKCCFLLTKDPDYSVTLNESSTLMFEDVTAGTYLLVNEVEGKPAGLEQFVDVKENSKIDLGKIAIDGGGPLRREGGRIYRERPPVP